MRTPAEARILVVDDEHANVTLLARLLFNAGYRNVTTTTDSREVGSLWESVSPDLLLLDLMMPHSDGFEVMKSLGAEAWSDAGTFIPILVLTADVTGEVRNRALSAGAKDFLTKPFDHDEVRLRIRNLLETRFLHLQLTDSNHTLEETVQERTAELRESLQSLQLAHGELSRSRTETIRRLSIAAEMRDDDTGQHIMRMSRYTALLARAAGLDEDFCAVVELASPMHDVGKIGIPDSVLLKPGKLTPDERAIMERHPVIGFDVLSGSSSELLIMAASIALTHHERVDGTGYPAGLKCGEIPVEGLLASIADVFDALTSDRVYRPAMPIDEALGVMRQGRGTQFDATLLDLFFRNVFEISALEDVSRVNGRAR